MALSLDESGASLGETILHLQNRCLRLTVKRSRSLKERRYFRHILLGILGRGCFNGFDDTLRVVLVTRITTPPAINTMNLIETAVEN